MPDRKMRRRDLTEARESLADHLARARRAGLPVAVVVRVHCPSCGADDVRSNGRARGIGYHDCRSCGAPFRSVYARPDELRAQGEPVAAPVAKWRLSVTMPTPADPVDDETRAMARAALEGWRVRLAAVRTEKRLAHGDVPAPPTSPCCGGRSSDRIDAHETAWSRSCVLGRRWHVLREHEERRAPRDGGALSGVRIRPQRTRRVRGRDLRHQDRRELGMDAKRPRLEATAGAADCRAVDAVGLLVASSRGPDAGGAFRPRFAVLRAVVEDG